MTPSRLATVLLVCIALAPRAHAVTNWQPRARAVADFLLAQQTDQGCIPDAPGRLRANRDGAMAWTLVGLAHTCRVTHDERAARGLRDGLFWLAERMEKTGGDWCGSWRYAYSAKPPHLALPTSPHAGAVDGQGSTAASALFVYAVALHADFTRDPTTTRRLVPYCRAACDFLIERNRGDNGFFHHCWVKERGATEWTRDPIQWSTDQAAAYLGLRAGYWLTRDSRYHRAAEKLQRIATRLLFDERRRIFGLGIDPRGKLMPAQDDPDGWVIQAYLGWVFGANNRTRAAMRWLATRVGSDGTVRRTTTEVPHTIAAAAFALGAGRTGLHHSQRDLVVRTLRDNAVSAKGGVRAILGKDGKIENVLAGWLVPAWIGASPLPF